MKLKKKLAQVNKHSFNTSGKVIRKSSHYIEHF